MNTQFFGCVVVDECPLVTLSGYLQALFPKILEKLLVVEDGEATEIAEDRPAFLNLAFHTILLVCFDDWEVLGKRNGREWI